MYILLSALSFNGIAVLILLLSYFRFDARLLLTSLPPSTASHPDASDPLAGIGWDDLDSDSEDTFFMSAAEIEMFKADKSRREMEESRQKRMRALEEREAAERDPNDPAGWGGSDEEVCPTSVHFMHSAMHSLRFIWALSSLTKSNVPSWNARRLQYHALITPNN